MRYALADISIQAILNKDLSERPIKVTTSHFFEHLSRVSRHQHLSFSLAHISPFRCADERPHEKIFAFSAVRERREESGFCAFPASSSDTTSDT